MRGLIQVMHIEEPYLASVGWLNDGDDMCMTLDIFNLEERHFRSRPAMT